MSTPHLLLPTDYVKKATEHINNATEHVSFLCMTITDDIRTNLLIDALSAAAQRGVTVEVAADTFTYGEFGGHFIPLKYYTKKSRVTTAMAKQLIASGVKFTWLGRFTTIPISGRTHIKCLVVDDTVYSFGGVNLYEAGIDNADYMFQCKDKQLAMELRDDIARLTSADGKNFSYRSHEFSYLKNSKVLVDGGFQGDSIIYREVCKLAKDAKDILLVSQYCPSGKLGRLIKKTNHRLYFNPPENATHLNRFVIRVGMVFSGNRSMYKHKKYLHAKFMIFTMNDGRKVAVTGSHNFIYAGVILGTREIALETEDKKIISQLETFFDKYIK